MTVSGRIILYLFIITLSCSGLLAQDKNGVILKAGASSTIFHKNNGAALISNGSAGNTIGFDGMFYDGKLLIHPGIHLMTFPKRYGSLKGAFSKVLSRPDSTYDFAFKMPVRLGADLIDLGAVRLKGAVGFYGLYSPYGIDVRSEDIDKIYYVSGGWTLNVGLILKFFTLEMDYDASLCKRSADGPMFMRSISFTAGLYF